MKVEYKVRAVTRFILTRYEDSETSAGISSQRGEYDNAEVAYQVGYAMCRLEHEKSGEELDSMNFIYPSPVGEPYPQAA